MAKLIRDEEVEIVDGHPIFTYHWKGVGVARMPNTWLWKGGGVGCFTGRRALTLEDISLRIIGFDRIMPFSDVYVVQDNPRWPLWWLLLRIWLFLRWFEGNLRLTATVWGLLKNEMGCMPQWSDFVVLRWIRERR